MTILRSALGSVLTVSLLFGVSWSQTPTPAPGKKAPVSSSVSNVHTTDDPEVIRETQMGINGNGYVGLVWWIPFEFWIDSATKRGADAGKTRESLKSLQDYTVVGAFLAKVSSLG